MSRIPLVRIALAFVFTACLLEAQTTWTGAVSSAWNVAGNWTAGVPNSGVAAIIAAAANAPDTTGVPGPACRDLTIQAGATLTSPPAWALNVHGSVSNSGSQLGALTLLGTGTVGGAGTFDLINDTAGPYTLTDVTCNRFYQTASAALVTVQSLHVLGDTGFLGAGLTGGAGSTLRTDNSITVSTSVPVTAPPQTIRVANYWTSNANWQPAAGTVWFDGPFGAQIAVAAGSNFHGLEFEAQATSVLTGDLRVTGALNLRSNLTVSGTTIDLGQRAGLSSSTQLLAMAATTLRLRDGITAAGVVFTPNATLDADGPLTFFISGGLALGGGNHTLSGSLSMSGQLLLPATATLLFDGSGSITVAASNLLPNLRITGSNYTVFDATIGGNLDHAAAAGSLAVFRCRVDGTTTLRGSTVTGFAGGSLDANGNVVWQTSAATTAPPAVVTCAGSWTSDANFQPASGTVVFDGSGAQSVTMPAFRWCGLRIAAGSQVATALPVLTIGALDVQGQLTCSGNDVDAAGLLRVTGQLQANSSARIRARAGLDVAGSLQATAARLDADGAVTVAGTVALGNGDHLVTGPLTVGGSLQIPPAQRLLLDGSGAIDVVPGSPLPIVLLAGGNYTCTRLTVTQDLVQQSGVLTVLDCRVLGNASFQGAGLADAGGGLLDVRGDVGIQASAPITAPPATFRCGRNWTADASFAPASGLVELDGSGAQTVSMPAFQWHDLRIGVQSQVSTGQAATMHGFLDLFGTLTTAGNAVQVDDKLTVAATGTLAAANATSLTLGADSLVAGSVGAAQATLQTLGSLTIASGGALAIGAGPHQLHGSLAATGSLSTAANSELRFVGSGSVDVANAIVLPRATFAGDYLATNLVVGNALAQTGGRLRVQALRSLGTASFAGSTVENVGSGLLDVAGSLTFATTNVVVSPPLLVRCGGAWSSNNQFLPAAGTVELYGSQPQTMAAPLLSLASLRVLAGASVSFGPADVIVQQQLEVAGSLQAPAGVLEVRGNLTLPAGGNLQLPPGCTCTAAMSLQNAGSIAGGGALAMVGAGTLSGSGSLPRLRIAASGTIAVAGSVAVIGDLTLAAGRLQLNAGATLQVGNDFSASGGVLGGGAGAVLDVTGDVALDGVTAHAGGVPDVHCDGDWSARSSYLPPGGSVFLDGPGQLLALDGSLNFADLRLTNGVRQLAADAIAAAATLTVGAGATLDLGTHRLDLGAATIAVNGALAIGAGGHLQLAPAAALTVASGGSLRLIGSYTAPATIDGAAGNGYSCNIAGAVAAMNFVFAHMGPAGVRITGTATLAAAPQDLRSGWFRDGAAAPGSCLLHIDRPVATQLRYLRFEDAGTAAFNVRSSGAGRIALVNDGGNFTGPTHEDDPGNVIDWLPAEHTQLLAFGASSAVHRNELRFATGAEVDVQLFLLQRSSSGAAGPWTDVVGTPLPPLGTPSSGASYAVTDLAVVDGSRYDYRLQEQLLHGELRLLGSDFARPWAQQVGNTWVVGTGGHADVAAAVAAAAPGGTVLVQAGTYAAFTVDKPLHIVADGSGPVVIDTSTAQLLVQNMPLGAADVALYGLQIGGPTSPFGLVVRNCDNVVVLHGLQVTTATGVTGVQIDDSNRVAMQACSITGDPGLRLQNQSLLHLSLGNVDELVVDATSRAVYCDVVPGSLTVAPGGSAALRAGVMPGMQLSPVWASEKPASIELTGGAFDLYGLALSMRRDYLDLSFVFPIDMVLLLDHTLAFTMATGLLDNNGRANLSLLLPNLPTLWGSGVPLQVLTLRANGTGRMGMTRDLLIMP